MIGRQTHSIKKPPGVHGGVPVRVEEHDSVIGEQRNFEDVRRHEARHVSSTTHDDPNKVEYKRLGGSSSAYIPCHAEPAEPDKSCADGSRVKSLRKPAMASDSKGKVGKPRIRKS